MGKSAQGSSAVVSSLNILAAMVGGGLLSLPFALSQSGWSGITVLIAICLCANYTGRILIQNSKAPIEKGESTHVLPTYFSIAKYAFGATGGWILLFLQYAVLLSVSVLYLLLAALNEKQFFDAMGWFAPLPIPLYILINMLLVLLPVIVLKTMKEVGIVAALGVATAVLLALLIVFLSIFYPNPNAVHHVVVWDQYPFAFSTFVFSFGGHAIFPSVHAHMKHPHQFNLMFNISYVLVMVLYLPPTITGYLAFGDGTLSPILGNLPNNVYNYIGIWAITIHVLMVFPIILNPVVLAIEELLYLNVGVYKEEEAKESRQTSTLHDIEPSFRSMEDVSQRKSSYRDHEEALFASVDTEWTIQEEVRVEEVSISTPLLFRYISKKWWIRFEILPRAILRTVLVIILAGIAAGVPHFADLMALVGATAVSVVAFFTPIFIHLKNYWKVLSVVEVLWTNVILMLAWLGSSIGTTQAIIALIKDITGYTVPISSSDFWYVVAGSGGIGLLLIASLDMILVGYWARYQILFFQKNGWLGKRLQRIDPDLESL